MGKGRKAGRCEFSRFSLLSISPFPLLKGLALLLLSCVVACSQPSAGKPFRPSQSTSSGSSRTINVPANGDVQSALDSAKPGDTIVLEAGSTYSGHFTLRDKPGSAYITLTTSALSSLPPEGARVNPSFSRYMPKLVSPNDGPTVGAVHGAHHYRFVGIELHPKEGVYQWDVIAIGQGNETSLSALPHDIVFDRVYIHGDPAVGSKRGIALNGASITVENSYISDFKSTEQDTQALNGWNGPGPFRIVNNYLEASAENIMFGGSPAAIPNLVPSDITISRNYFVKPLSWNPGDPSFAGTHWVVKNIFELKNARRVVLDGNIFECGGAAFLYSPRTENRANPWAVVEDVTFTHNIVHHADGGVTMAGHDDDGLGGRGANFTFRDNLFEDIKSTNWPGATARLWSIFGGASNVVIDHNTAFGELSALVFFDGRPLATGFIYTNNIAPPGTYSLHALEGASDPIIRRNVIYWDGRGNESSPRPADNFYPKSIDRIGFGNVVEGQYQLLPTSPYKNKGTDGKDIGADLIAIRAATAGVIEGRIPSTAGGHTK